MKDWIIIVGLYALVVGLFHILGGLGAAAEAFQRWGAAHTTTENSRVRSSR
jgi:uncharacterized membrane protein HdeD (DUF308 family)